MALVIIRNTEKIVQDVVQLFLVLMVKKGRYIHTAGIRGDMILLLKVLVCLMGCLAIVGFWALVFDQ